VDVDGFSGAYIRRNSVIDHQGLFWLADASHIYHLKLDPVL